MQLEHKAGVIVESAAEGGRELDTAHVDAACGQEASAAFKQIERGVKLERAILGDGAQLGRRLVGVARDRQEAFDQRARLARQ